MGTVGPATPLAETVTELGPLGSSLGVWNHAPAGDNAIRGAETPFTVTVTSSNVIGSGQSCALCSKVAGKSTRTAPSSPGARSDTPDAAFPTEPAVSAGACALSDH